MNITALKGIGQTALKNAPKIAPTFMTAVGATITLAIPFVTAKQTLKARDILEEEGLNTSIFNKELNSDDRIRMIKAVAPVYAPVALMTIAAAGLVIGGMVLKNKQYAALLAVCALNEEKLKEYKAKVEELFGKEAADKIGEEKLKEKAEKVMTDMVPWDEKKEEEDAYWEAQAFGNHHQDINRKNLIVIDGDGTTICVDLYSGKPFKCDISTLKRAETYINEHIYASAYTCQTLNDFYNFIGIDEIELGNLVGWDAEHPLHLKFHHYESGNGIPVLGVDYTPTLIV